MAMDDTLSAVAGDDSLADLAKKLTSALENPNSLKVGEFAAMVGRLQAEMALVKDSETALSAVLAEADVDWAALLEGKADDEAADGQSPLTGG